jgi:hypothetical protein
MSVETKICSGKVSCGKEKPLDDFPQQKQSKDGYGSSCKECVKIYKKYYYEANKKLILTNQKQYYEENKTDCLIRNKN